MGRAFAFVKSGPVDRGCFEHFRESISPSWVEAALLLTGTATVRRRRLPAEQVLWLVIGMALFRNLSIVDVVRELELSGPGDVGVVPSATTQARERLGPEPLRWLFERCGSTWAHASADKLRWRGLALYGMDGTTARVPDSEENRAHFGSQDAGENRGNSGYPLVRMVTLMALRSHVLAAARFGPYDQGELAYASELWNEIPDHSLAIVDRGFLAAGWLIPFAAAGQSRHWLTRAKKRTRWTTLKKLGPGDELVEIDVPRALRAEQPELPEKWVVRALRYQRRGFQPQTLLTSLLDAKAYPAAELRELYHERWEIELGYDEVKTEMLEREETIRSKKPRNVEQELWGLLLAYNLVRREMEAVAHEAGVPPTRVSFVAGLRFVRSALLSFGLTSSPGTLPKRLLRLRADLTHFILPERRARAYPRAVKIKMSNYNRKRNAATGGRPN